MKKRDLTGQRFGKLVVDDMIYGVEVYGRKRTLCRCTCDCGNIKDIVVDNLTGGKRISCGCDASSRRRDYNRKDLTGMTFGRLLVKEMIWDNKPTRVKCVCSCGKEVIVRSAQLTSGKTQSCGCLHREIAADYNTKDWTGVSSQYGILFISPAKRNKQNQWLWTCECGLCHKHFDALPAKVMNGHITSCGCRKQSAREQLISSILAELNVDFDPQYELPECKYKQTLIFDFAIYKNGEVFCLLEYDGKQHFFAVDHFGGEEGFEKTKIRDEIKNEFCRNNGIRLIRLPYTLSDSEIRKKIESIIYP